MSDLRRFVHRCSHISGDDHAAYDGDVGDGCGNDDENDDDGDDENDDDENDDDTFSEATQRSNDDC